MPFSSHRLSYQRKRRKPSYVTGLDSATQALQATAHYLHDKELVTGGPVPQLTTALAEAAACLPHWLSDALVTGLGWLDASPARALRQVRAETLSKWAVSQYPQQRYPAVMIGSSNGAATHLCAALGIPWLPQTLLVCTRHSGDKDDPKQVMVWAKDRVQQLLEANPDLAVYQMHDPNQDRLKVGHVAYFRLKRTRLGETYKRFLQQSLMPGGTLLLLECQYSWPITQANDRHLFQVGGKGGVLREEYVHGSPRIADFLKGQGSSHRQWHAPTPDGDGPESEWGFEPALREDVMAFAADHGLKVRRIVFNEPQALSPLVTDLYRWWYQERGIPSHRLLVESFTYLHPWWTLRHGLVPYWTVFNDKVSLDLLKRYLEGTQPYDEIFLTLFSNGLHSLGSASIDQWRSEILAQARHRGQFLGVNEHQYPRDNGSVSRHYLDLKRLPGQLPMPYPLSLYQLDEFLSQSGDRYAVHWLDEIG